MLALLSCDGAREGAAALQGSVNGTAFDGIASVRIHGAGPFRIEVATPKERDVPETEPPKAPGRYVRFSLPRPPPSGVAVAVGGPEELTAIALSIVSGPVEPEPGKDRIDPDGGFAIRPVAGEVRVDFHGGTRPGDGVTGRFRLEFGDGGWIEGRIAGELAD